MFGKKDEITQEIIDSLIGENIRITGKIEGEGNIRIDGKIKGDIDYNGDVIISETGSINGNISCNNISISGNVDGNVNTKGKLTLLSTGKLIGDIEVSALEIHDNGIFQGSCKMIEKNTIEAESMVE